MSKNIYDPALQHGLYGLLEGADRHSNGQTFFVDSTIGENTAGGTWGESWETPFATVNYAMSKCTTGADNVILVAAAHVETITATSTSSGSSTGQFCIDKGDVSIVGMGRGTKRPTFTFTTAAAAGVHMVGTSPNVLLSNLLFINNYTGGGTAAITVAANCYGLTVENCEFRETANTKEWLLAISLASAIEDVTIRGCRFHNIDGGTATAAIKTAGTAPRLKVYDNWFRGDWSGPVLDLDADHVYDVEIRDNVINNIDAAAGIVIALTSSGTGAIHDNLIHTGLPTAAPITAAACLIGPNSITFDEGVTGGLSNLHPAKGRVSKTYVNWTAAKHTLFDVVGPVRVDYIVGVVKATIKVTTMNINLDATTTDPGGDLAIASLVDMTGDAVGSLLTVNGTFGSALVVTVIGAVADTTEAFFMNTGAITMESSAEEDEAGSIEWSIAYTALAPGAYITAAATD